jgi:acid phosphatase type 7
MRGLIHQTLRGFAVKRSFPWMLPAALLLVACSATAQSAGTPAPEAPAPVAAAAVADSGAHVEPSSAAPISSEPVILIGAGDIAGCESDGDYLTAEILDTIPGIIFTVGDHAYPTGTFQQFRDCYDRAWGRHKARTRPSPGNHDYMTQAGGPYFNYFGAAAGERGRGYYAYDAGAWRVIVLNSEIPARRGSPQERWLRAELETNPRECIIAYWHRPLYSSVRDDRRYRMEVKPLWDVLYAAGADVVINGHDHVYERYAKLDPNGRRDEGGIRQFIVGTGGRSLYPFGRPSPHSEVRDNTTYGLLKFSLYDGRYEWQFVPAGASTFTDSGTDSCSPRR